MHNTVLITSISILSK